MTVKTKGGVSTRVDKEKTRVKKRREWKVKKHFLLNMGQPHHLQGEGKEETTKQTGVGVLKVLPLN
jgi:hypothetical protein